MPFCFLSLFFLIKFVLFSQEGNAQQESFEYNINSKLSIHSNIETYFFSSLINITLLNQNTLLDLTTIQISLIIKTILFAEFSSESCIMGIIMSQNDVSDLIKLYLIHIKNYKKIEIQFLGSDVNNLIVKNEYFIYQNITYDNPYIELYGYKDNFLSNFLIKRWIFLSDYSKSKTIRNLEAYNECIPSPVVISVNTLFSFSFVDEISFTSIHNLIMVNKTLNIVEENNYDSTNSFSIISSSAQNITVTYKINQNTSSLCSLSIEIIALNCPNKDFSFSSNNIVSLTFDSHFSAVDSIIFTVPTGLQIEPKAQTSISNIYQFSSTNVYIERNFRVDYTVQSTDGYVKRNCSMYVKLRKPNCPSLQNITFYKNYA